jgi:tricorn protease-like protein
LIPDKPDAVIDYATWSPTGAKVAFVLNHDIYIHNLPTGAMTRVTYDGDADVFNGVADWVFEGPLPLSIHAYGRGSVRGVRVLVVVTYV